MQMSLFGAATAEPAAADFDGILIAGGHWVRHGVTARVSAVVADRWRADALHEAFHERGVGETEDPIVRAENGFVVRSAFAAALSREADRWTSGANEAPPVGFAMGVGALRLWAMTAGRRDDVGYLLATHSGDDIVHTIAGAQLSRLNLAAVSLTARAGGPGWRITSTKRLRRLAELLGESPVGSDRDWPTF